jgi:hypothetical protein
MQAEAVEYLQYWGLDPVVVVATATVGHCELGQLAKRLLEWQTK